MERRERLELELADARVEYAEALQKIVETKRKLAYLAILGTAAEPEPEHSYGEHELNIILGEK